MQIYVITIIRNKKEAAADYPDFVVFAVFYDRILYKTTSTKFF